MTNFSIYKNKKVFITGHTGFKGGWLSVWLHSLGAEITGYALKPDTNPNLYELCKNGMPLPLHQHEFIANICDCKKIKAAILDFQPDFIFHLAAQAIVKQSYSTPLETFDTNVMGTAHILDAMRFLKKKCVAVMITTDKVYKNNETGQPYSENDAFGGYDPYSASKAASEIVIDSYRSSFFNHSSIASARAGNVIGGGDWANYRLLPDIVRSLSKNENIIIRNPHSVRPWQHVLEPLSGYLTLGAKLYENPAKYAQGYNFGPNPNDTLTVKEMAEMAVDIWRKSDIVSPTYPDRQTPLPQIQYPDWGNQPHEAVLLSLSITKAETELEWKPKWNAKTALQNTIDWYKNYQTTNVYEMCMKQIRDYSVK
jgi:CDP-glucose 4,6-dehydratase